MSQKAKEQKSQTTEATKVAITRATTTNITSKQLTNVKKHGNKGKNKTNKQPTGNRQATICSHAANPRAAVRHSGGWLADGPLLPTISARPRSAVTRA